MKEAKMWIRIAHCDDIPLREGRAVVAGNREVAVFNLGDHFLAVGNRCPHKGGPLADGIVSGATVVCPLHAGKLSLETGKGLTGPSASSCVETFRTRVQQGVVFVEISNKITRAEEAVEEGLHAVCVQYGALDEASESQPAT